MIIDLVGEFPSEKIMRMKNGQGKEKPGFYKWVNY
jgi:hypothetical protein